MNQFEKGLDIVEAMPFTSETKNRVFHWVRCNCYADFVDGEPALRIETPEGEMTARLGDWVIKNAKGEFLICEQKIFETEYEGKVWVSSELR